MDQFFTLFYLLQEVSPSSVCIVPLTELYPEFFSNCNLSSCAILKNKENKTLLSIRCVFHPRFANWASVNEPTSVAHLLEYQMFISSNCHIFAVECVWNNKFSQNVKSLRFFKEKYADFLEKNLEVFSKTVVGGKFAVEWVY